jgi:hypothetical protein
MKLKLTIAFVLGQLLASAVVAQSDWHTYPVRKIFDLLQQEQQLADRRPPADMAISAKPFPAKTLVKYEGKKRPIGKYGRHFIEIWVQSRNVPPENAALLVEEHLFKEDDREIWMPVHKAVAPSLEESVKPGDEMIIYYFYLGGFNGKTLQDKDTLRDKSASIEEDKLKWMLAVERFEKPRPTAFVPQALEEAIDRNMEAPGRILDIWFDPRQVRTKARLVFTGDVRPIPPRRQLLIDVWFEKYRFPVSAASLIANEARFLEGGKEYWIAVRNTTLEELRKAPKKNEPVVLNTILAGGIRNGDSVDWVFISGEISR